jgi:hypothetical protein
MRHAVAALLGSLVLALPAPSEAATGCGADAAAGLGGLDVTAQCAQPGSESDGVTSAVKVSDGKSPYVDYRWRWPCNAPAGTDPFPDCGAAQLCTDRRERVWDLYGRIPGQGWIFIRSQCFGAQPEAFEPPTVTPGMVLSELRRVGLPALEIEIQPETKTLVNFDTIFHTDPRPVDVDLTILGQAVQVRASPRSYVWQFGDGSSVTTGTPGAPYPSKEIVHRYLDADVTVEPSVSVVYGARFRVGGGAWQDVDGTVTIPGPPEGLRVVEAVGVLSGEHD